MGYIAHEAVIASTYGEEQRERIECFRELLPVKWRGSLVGPIPAQTNGDDFWAFMPDGSKEGWPTSDVGEGLRDEFVGLLRHMRVDFVSVRFGGDYGMEFGANVVAHGDES